MLYYVEFKGLHLKNFDRIGDVLQERENLCVIFQITVSSVPLNREKSFKIRALFSQLFKIPRVVFSSLIAVLWHEMQIALHLHLSKSLASSKLV